jgi:hypothetical protein
MEAVGLLEHTEIGHLLCVRYDTANRTMPPFALIIYTGLTRWPRRNGSGRQVWVDVIAGFSISFNLNRDTTWNHLLKASR